MMESISLAPGKKAILYQKTRSIELWAISQHRKGKPITVEAILKAGLYDTKDQVRRALKGPLRKILYSLGRKPGQYKPKCLQSEISKNVPLDKNIGIGLKAPQGVPLYTMVPKLSMSEILESMILAKSVKEMTSLELPTYTVQPANRKLSTGKPPLEVVSGRLSLWNGTCSCNCATCKKLGCASYVCCCRVLAVQGLSLWLEDLVLPFIRVPHVVLGGIVWFADAQGRLFIPGYRRDASAKLVYCKRSEPMDRIDYKRHVSASAPLLVFDLLPELLSRPLHVHHLNFSRKEPGGKIYGKSRTLNNGTRVINTRRTMNPLAPDELLPFIQTLTDEPEKISIDQIDVNYDMSIDPLIPHFHVQLGPGVFLYTKHQGPTTTLRLEHRSEPRCNPFQIQGHIVRSESILQELNDFPNNKSAP